MSGRLPVVHAPVVECCDLHTNTCGHLDYCCEQCPALGDGSYAQQLLAALGIILLIVLLAVAIA